MGLPGVTVDEGSLVLIALIAALLVYAKVQQYLNTPALNPLILQRQSEASAVHLPRESPVYRNVNAQIGFDLAMRPKRSVPTVAALLARGATGKELSHTRHVLDSSLSNSEVRAQAVDFMNGVCTLLKTDSPVIVVCGLLHTSHSLIALVASSVCGKGRTLVIPPGQAPTSLPQDIDLVKTAVVCIDTPLLPILKGAGLVVARANGEIQQTVVEWDDVTGASTQHDVPEVPEVTGLQSYDLDMMGAEMFATFWDGRSAWVDTTQTSMTSGVTAWLSEYPAHDIPTMNDVMLSDAMWARSVPAPAYVSLLLTALYTGAGIAVEPSTQLVSRVRSLRPTLLYLSTYGAQSIEQSLWIPSTGSIFHALMRRINMDLLRSGILPKGRILDRLVCRDLRVRLGLEDVRAAVLVGNGHAAEQSLLDGLRLYLGVPVMHAYLPEHMASNGHASLVTAPVSTSNMLDLQVFAPQAVDDSSGKCVGAQVGPPSVSLELKLVDDTPAVKKHAAAIEMLRKDSPDDPMGEVYIRGYTLTATGHDNTTISPWHATGDVAMMRSNGTLVIIAPSSAEEAGMLPNTISATDASERLAQRLKSSATKVKAATPAMLSMLLLLCATPSVQAYSSPMHHHAAMLTRRANSGDAPATNMTMINIAISGLETSQRASWEQGAMQSAIIEFYYPIWSVFAKKDKGVYPDANSLSLSDHPVDLVRLASQSVSGQDRSGRLASEITGDEQMGQGASMDSSSCGEGVLIGAWVNNEIQNNALNPNGFFSGAAERQLNYLLTNVSRAGNGAISQRAALNDVQLWSDSAYMGPPFFALYGLLSNNQSLVQLGYDQLRLQRNALRRAEGGGLNLWQHIVQLVARPPNAPPRPVDPRAWLTGNGWAASGLLRVAAIIRESPWAEAMTTQYNDLIAWADEIIEAAYGYADRNTGLLYNEVDNSTSFFDASGSALMSYATFRLGSMEPGRRAHIDTAENAYKTLSTALDPASSFTNGIQTVNELSSGAPGPTSTESLAFMVLMSAARRDYYAGNTTGANGTIKAPTTSTDNGALGGLASSSAMMSWALAMASALALTWIM